MAVTNERKIKEYETPEVIYATCSNGIPLFRGRNFPICDDCLKVLREIIKENKCKG